MKKPNKMRFMSLLLTLTLVFMMAIPAMTMAAVSPLPVNLGTAVNFAVLAGSTITNTGLTTISGDVGLAPGLATDVTGFPPGTVSGTIYAADAVATAAKADLVTAYNNIITLPVDENLTGQDLGGLTRTTGVYHFNTSAQLTGSLTLDGNSSDVFIFQIGSTLTTAASSSVNLINGVLPSNVFWQVGSSATLGTNSTFKGTILANASITATTGANVTGRLLARNAAVTLDTNTITNPINPTYTVTFDSQGGSAVAAISGITTGGTVTLPIVPTKAGSTFASWNTAANGSGTAFTAATAVIANITVYAQWTLNPTYTVTFNSQGGSAVAAISGITGGSTTALPIAPTKAGINFAGWNTVADGSGTAFTAATAVIANITVYAQWTLNPTYTVTFNSQGGSAVAAISGITGGSTTALPIAPTKAGINFAGWNTVADGSGTAFTAATAVIANITVYAQWTLNPTYTVTFNSQGGSAVAAISGITGGATTALPIVPTKAGSTFAGWNTVADGSGTAFTAATAVIANITVYAQWTLNGGGSGGGVTVSHTTTVQTGNNMVVTANSVVLNGDITSDNGYEITNYGFLWGPSASNLTNKLDVGTDNHSGVFTANLGNLTTGTRYYFQAFATNSQGTADGAVLSFSTTGSPPPTTPTAPITPITPTMPTASVLSDVSASYWGNEAISSLSSKGIVSGYPDGSFKPDDSITRAEFATILVKALGLSTSGVTAKFTDITEDSWCYGTVNAAASASLVSGIDGNLFAPNGLITREQIAAMVTKGLGDKTPVTDGTELNAFSDKSAVSSWAVSGMAEAVKAGIISMNADMLAPQADATRVQAAVMIYKMLAALGK